MLMLQSSRKIKMKENVFELCNKKGLLDEWFFFGGRVGTEVPFTGDV